MNSTIFSFSTAKTARYAKAAFVREGGRGGEGGLGVIFSLFFEENSLRMSEEWYKKKNVYTVCVLRCKLEKRGERGKGALIQKG